LKWNLYKYDFLLVKMTLSLYHILGILVLFGAAVAQDDNSVTVGTPTYSTPQYKFDNGTYNGTRIAGDIIHENAVGFGSDLGKLAETQKIVTREIANGLRASFPRIRQLATAFADEEGYVRNGLVFCGAEFEEDENGAKTTNEFDAWPVPDSFHPDKTQSLSYHDGFSKHDDSTSDRCGRNNCREGSIVSTLARFIRAHGYHVRHDDICKAIATTAPTLSARTCNLQNQTSARLAWTCPSSAAENSNDWWQVNKQCYGFDKTDCDAVDLPKCAYDDIEQFCRASDTFMASTDAGCSSVSDVAEAEAIPVGQYVNEIWRVLGFSVNDHAALTTDKSYVTGSPPNECTTLRALINALNGNAQINAFRDLGVEEAAAHWREELKGVRSYLTALSNLLTSFYPISLNMFPFIENEQIEGCAMGEVEHLAQVESGTDEQPLCETNKRQTMESLNRISEAGQSMSRSRCFCRNGKLDGEYGKDTGVYDKHEFDQLYLESDIDGPLPTREQCKSDYADKLPSVYTYCANMQNWGDNLVWKKTLRALRPRKERIHSRKSGLTADEQETLKNTIITNLENTLPTNENTCGRVVNADSEGGDKVKYSNKGGNCIPFEKLHEVIYRIEFETSRAETGKSKISKDPAWLTGTNAGKTALKYGDYFCNQDHSHSNTKFSFRQMAYLWDHVQGGSSDNQTISSNSVTDKFRPQEAHSFPTDYLTYETTSGSFPKRSRYELTERDFCFVDWIGDFSGASERLSGSGEAYENPYNLYGREIDEATWNTAIAIASKKKVKIDNLELWDVLEEQLTYVETGNLLDAIGKAATRHFMRVTSTDTNDSEFGDYANLNNFRRRLKQTGYYN